jgi:ubiquinone/menaquinone biosynthesis C-methylase UbiE
MINAESYHAIATGPFAPLYPFYATRILARTGVRSGSCLDVGCGGGYLGLAVAEQSGLNLFLLDQSPAMLAKARENVQARALSTPVEILEGRVQAIPLPDAAVELVVSRGSIPFWDKLPNAFREIFRVLKPGGFAYVGGGLGTPEMRKAIMCEMQARDPHWRSGEHSRIPHHPEGHYEDALREAGIGVSQVTRGETGTWVEFQKPASDSPAAAGTRN